MIKRSASKLISSFCLLLFLSISGISQVAYHNFSSNDGLPSNEVYCVHQDRDGFLWFGTDHGVVRYNGYSFKVFTTTDGLTDNTILDMKEDDDGRLWFLTYVGGICYYDGNRFFPHPNNDTITKLCNSRIPTAWEILKNNQTWLAFENAGFYRIENNKTEAISAISTKAGNDSLNFYVLNFNNNKYIYASSYSRQLTLLNTSGTSSLQSFTFSLNIIPFSGGNFGLKKFADGSMLINQWNYLVFINKHHKPVRYLRPGNVQTVKTTITGDKIWISNKNMPTYSPSFKNEAMQFIDSFTFVNAASMVISDRQGNYWISTLDKGIYMVPNDKVRIFKNSGLPTAIKTSGLACDSKKLYAALPEGQLLIIDTLFKSYVEEAPVKQPSPVTSMFFKKNGQLLSNQDTTFFWLNTHKTQIIEIGPQNYVVGSQEGLLITDHRTVTFDSRITGFNKRITAIHPLAPAKYAIGTLTGLYYLMINDHPRLVQEVLLTGIRITAVKALNKNVFAVATRGKGIFLNINNRFHNINQAKNLISDLAEDIYFENDSVLWVATFNGVSKIYFRLQTDSLITRIKNYTKEDGLCSNQVNSIQGFKGFIWLATNEGLCYFDPKNLTEDTIRVPLYLGSISVNGIKRSKDSLTLTHNEKNIFIEFNALYYKAIEGIRYKVRLKGTGPWKYTNLNYIQYYGLPPGEYQFEVAADDNYGKYRSNIHTLHFIIKPRFVDTVWFRVVLGLIVLLIAGVIISSIFSYQKLKATNVIKLLQAEFKALSYQINPHFIFNVLNSIQYYILKKDTDNAVHLLGSFSLLIRRIVNNSRQQYIGIIEEVECLREYMDLEKMRLDNKFEYSINIDSSIDIEDKNILPMIIQPLVENSIWHGIVPSSKPGIIRIDFKKENGTVICTVEDNGIGINAKAVNKEKNQNNLSLAMKNVSERLKIISELNDSTWAIKTEDKSVTDPLQSGTIVIIVFPAVKSKP